MKKVLTIILSIIILSMFASCGETKTSSNDVTTTTTTNTTTAKATQTTELATTIKETTKKSLKAQKNNNDTVSIDIPASLIGKNATDKLTDEQKNNGFKKAVVNKDGSVTYTMDSQKYVTFLKEYQNTVAESLDKIKTDGNYKSIKKVDYNDNFSEITLTVDKAKFENGMDSVAIMQAGISAAMYQAFDINSNSKSKTTINVKDSKTGKVFKTEKYPK